MSYGGHQALGVGDIKRELKGNLGCGWWCSESLQQRGRERSGELAGRGWRGGGRNCHGSEAREVEWTHAQNQKQKQLLVTRIPNLDDQDKNKI